MATDQTLTLRRPDDWHVHFRDGDFLSTVVPATASVFARAIVMPNLVPPVTTVDAARAYRDRIMTEVPDGVSFTPLMTAYLTDNLDPDELKRGQAEDVFTAVKLYPAGATTNSDAGVTDLKNVSKVLEVMQDIGMPLLIHGEVTDHHIDVFDREAVFIDKVMTGLLRDFPALKVVFEHITTRDAADFVKADTSGRLGATITAHHLMINRTDLFRGGIRPHLYCLPIAKREGHRLALREAATSGDPKFFLGSDTAPHPKSAKEAACGCAGIYSAPVALPAYAQVFDEEGALDKLEAFASLNGPAFYGLPPNEETVTLHRADWAPDGEVVINGEHALVPFLADEGVPWQVGR